MSPNPPLVEVKRYGEHESFSLYSAVPSGRRTIGESLPDHGIVRKSGSSGLGKGYRARLSDRTRCGGQGHALFVERVHVYESAEGFLEQSRKFEVDGCEVPSKLAIHNKYDEAMQKPRKPAPAPLSAPPVRRSSWSHQRCRRGRRREGLPLHGTDAGPAFTWEDDFDFG
jgi:hypothetical protein